MKKQNDFQKYNHPETELSDDEVKEVISLKSEYLKKSKFKRALTKPFKVLASLGLDLLGAITWPLPIELLVGVGVGAFFLLTSPVSLFVSIPVSIIAAALPVSLIFSKSDRNGYGNILSKPSKFFFNKSAEIMGKLNFDKKEIEYLNNLSQNYDKLSDSNKLCFKRYLQDLIKYHDITKNGSTIVEYIKNDLGRIKIQEELDMHDDTKKQISTSNNKQNSKVISKQNNEEEYLADVK